MSYFNSKRLNQRRNKQTNNNGKDFNNTAHKERTTTTNVQNIIQVETNKRIRIDAFFLLYTYNIAIELHRLLYKTTREKKI